ncbi:AcrR family transcriptional regulator [Novosphingobium capsulatum]|uniref:AcrR family transcriptional regulator n=1 Tax=Novosphingobium capsulatum TaxID=13688 RepID=A0ABU1MKV0_9SPHN|nr:helix-turn-helix domain-containing protein [Novosphingobium capsulatum]MDR6510969.1 AcrR family transcriptional regulator [Novosphingobium capsulatum]
MDAFPAASCRVAALFRLGKGMAGKTETVADAATGENKVLKKARASSAGSKAARPRATPKRDAARNQDLEDTKVVPRSRRAIETYEKLIAAAGELLGEVGFERLTTNAICERAQLTPPALYRYFDDKYQIIEELATRLQKRQFDAFAVWLFKNGATLDTSENPILLADWFRTASEIIETQPGGVWTIRAMRALPHLAHVRLEWQRRFTDQMFRFYRPAITDLSDETLWARLRIRAEFGFVVDELALEEDRVARSTLFKEAALILTGMSRLTTS